MILLVRPPDGGDHPTEYTRTEALGIEYLCAVLDASGNHPVYLDLEFFPNEIDTLRRTLQDVQPSVVGVSLSYPQAARRLCEVLDLIRTASPKTLIVAGGQFATVAWRELLSGYPGIDCILRFEGEPHISEVIRALEMGSDLKALPSLAYRDADQIVSNPPGSRVTDLDSIPFPYRRPDLVEAIKQGVGALSILGSRGCWWARCQYCAIGESLADSIWLPRSVKNIADEMEALIYTYRVNRFTMVDADFLGPPQISFQRATAFSQELNERRLLVSYSINARPENITEQNIERLLSSGLSLVYLGIEAGSDRQLQRWCRGISLKKTEMALRVLEKMQMPFRAGFIMFDPESSIGDLADNIGFLRRWPVIEPSLLIRGLEMRAGMPSYERIVHGFETQNAQDGYFLSPQVAAVVRICRATFGKPLLWLHRLSSAPLDNLGGSGETDRRLLERQVLLVLLQAMADVLDWVSANYPGISPDAENAFAVQLRRLIDENVAACVVDETHCYLPLTYLYARSCQ
jgi:B12 binding domain/Radical SAM superfamily